MTAPKRVLVVDDEPTIRRACERTLSAEGVDAVSVDSCEAAIAVVALGGIDVVVLDLMMPGVGGMEFLKSMRERGPVLPVVVISGYSTPEVREECRELGAATWLSKPFTPDDLWNAVLDAMGD